MKRVLWLVLAIIPFLLNTAGAEKITVDPNTPEARALTQNGDSDPRLAQKISYDCKIKPIREVIADLSTKTNITLVAGSNNTDWSVRDAKITMYMKDISLVEIMNSIARVMKLAWSKSGNKPDFSYRLVDDKQAVMDLEDILNGHSKELVAKRKALIAQLEAVAALTESETAALKQQSPYLYMMGKTGLAAAFVKFKRHAPQMVTAMTNGESIEISCSQLSKQAQASVLDIIRCSSWMVSGDPSDKMSEEDLKALTESLEEWQISVSNSPDKDYTLRPEVMGMYGILMVGDGRYGGVPIADPDHPYMKMMSRQMIAELEHDKKPRHDQMSMSAEERKLIQEFENDAQYLEPSVKHKPDPELQVKVRGTEYYNDLSDLVEHLDGTCPFSFITDSYKVNFESGIESIPEQEAPLQDYLQKCLAQTSFSWQRQGSVIEMWDRNWLTSKKAEIPDGLMEKWEKQIQETGTLDLNCIAEIATLTDEQLEGNIYNDDLFSESGNLFHQIDRSGDYLKVYDQLNKSQRNALFSTKGLSLSNLNSKQREAILTLIGGMDVPEDFPDLAASGLDLRAAATSDWDGQRFIYTIRGTINGAVIPGEYIISSPIFSFRTREEVSKYYEDTESEDGEYYEEDYGDEDYQEYDAPPPYDGPSIESPDYPQVIDPAEDMPSDPAEDLAP